jgi:hypothetical protein
MNEAELEYRLAVDEIWSIIQLMAVPFLAREKRPEWLHAIMHSLRRVFEDKLKGHLAKGQRNPKSVLDELKSFAIERSYFLLPDIGKVKWAGFKLDVLEHYPTTLADECSIVREYLLGLQEPIGPWSGENFHRVMRELQDRLDGFEVYNKQ